MHKRVMQVKSAPFNLRVLILGMVIFKEYAVFAECQQQNSISIKPVFGFPYDGDY
jgi:hypothetical protein